MGFAFAVDGIAAVKPLTVAVSPAGLRAPGYDGRSMRLATAMAVAVPLAWAAPSARAASGLLNTRLDTGIAWYLDKPAVDAPVYPGFHVALNADARFYRRLHVLVGGSIDGYRHGPDQARSETFLVRGGPLIMPLEFDGGTGFVEATVGYAWLHGSDRFAAGAGLGYMAQYGRLGIGLFSRYTQVVVPAGDDVKSLVFGVAAGVALVEPPRRVLPAVAPPADEDGDGVVDGKDQCPHTRRGAKVDENGCEVKAEILVEDSKPAAPKPEEPPPGPEPVAAPAPAPPPSDDDDQDGVPNAADECPGTTRGFPVDVVAGCPLLRRRFALPQVTFDPLTARPRKEATAQLDELLRLLRDRPAVRLRIVGYAGNAKDQPAMPERVLRRLAAQRAQVVLELLTARGLGQRRLKAAGAEKPDVDEIEIVVSGSLKVVKAKPLKGAAAAGPAPAPPPPSPQLSPPPAQAEPSTPPAAPGSESKPLPAGEAAAPTGPAPTEKKPRRRRAAGLATRRRHGRGRP
jgi:outer membrane protein OmpA-like peptidoglycan-associated protein